jgi:hypothetical protein
MDLNDMKRFMAFQRHSFDLSPAARRMNDPSAPDDTNIFDAIRPHTEVIQKKVFYYAFGNTPAMDLCAYTTLHKNNDHKGNSLIHSNVMFSDMY